MIENLWEQSSLGAALEQLAEERGEARGVEIGQTQTMRDMARVALEGRFGALSDDMLAAIESADTATLTAVVSHVGQGRPHAHS